jgi:hypothetical protein
MSSAIGHALAGLTIYSCHKTPGLKGRRWVWLGWLILLALLPDLDRLIPFLHQSNHHEVRISHSLFFALILPFVTIFVLFILGERGQRLRVRSLQAIAAGWSHPLLDLLVGVVGIHLFWPFSWQLIKLPWGILPSRGALYLTNYYLYKNLLIELGVLLPLFYSIYLRFNTDYFSQGIRHKIFKLLLLSSVFMLWAMSLER